MDRTTRNVIITLFVCLAVIGQAATAFADVRAYASGFAAYSKLPTFNLQITDPTLAAKLSIDGRKVDDTGALGGAFGIWQDRANSRWMWGLRGEIAYQSLTSGSQTLPASGTFFGQPFNGPLPVPSGDGSLTLFTGTMLVGVKLGSSPDRRVTPYFGIGAGADRARISFPTAPGGAPVSATDMSWTTQGVAGIDLVVHRVLAIYGEYRYTRLIEHEFQLGPQTNVLSARPRQVVVGIRVGVNR